MHVVAGVATGGKAHRARFHHTAGRAQVVHAVDGLHLQNGACGVHLHAQRARLTHVGERELERVHADAVGLMHGAKAVRIIHPVALHLLLGKHPGVIAEYVAHQLGFAAQKVHLLVAVGDVEMTSRLRLAFGELGHQVLECLKAFADFSIQLECCLFAITGDPA
ncbi:hypothetical protein SDC9_155643 [bioreactor metagenome]|uniref:Uncharacterized protein n=1 Tax=bioreactor metagenome TaxID=1076179 RepID=A0A645F254_9ZZZZ